MIRTGSICSHPYRKTGLYVIVKSDTGMYMARVKKQVGYPLSGGGIYKLRQSDLAMFTEVSFVEAYANYTEADLRKVKADTRKAKRETPDSKLPELTDFSTIPEAAKQRFYQMASDLSPENLSCDGELSRSRVKARFAQIMRDWRDLQTEIGFNVSIQLVEAAMYHHYSQVRSTIVGQL
jgi:hypothetical protein